MKEYKLVNLNKGIRFSREKDLEVSEDELNKWSEEGWELQQIVSPADGIGAMVAVMYREKRY